MKHLLTAILMLFFVPLSVIRAQSFDPFIQSRVDAVSEDTLVKYLQEFENLGIKDIYSPALPLTAAWIEDKYTALGYSDIQRDTFYYGGQTLYNLIITKAGTLFPEKYFIIDGHYDTRNGPGTNDNGSGTAILLEIARLMSDVSSEVSIRFIHFSAEEEGLVGSYHYVNEISGPQNHDIKLVFNIDEVGGVNGLLNNTLICERDESLPSSNNAASWAFTDTLVNLTSLYTSLQPEISYAYGSDYVPFQLNGNIITGYFEDNYSPYVHSINDSLSKLDTNYVYEVAKGSLAATLFFSGASGSATSLPDPGLNHSLFEIRMDQSQHTLLITNKSGLQDIDFLLYDSFGRFTSRFGINQNYRSYFSLEPINTGLYIYRLVRKNGELLETGKLFFSK